MRGTKAEAKAKLAELVAAVGKGAYVEPSKVTVAEHVRARVDAWEAAGRISFKTVERYRELVEHQIVPHIGAIQVQKLRPLDSRTGTAAVADADGARAGPDAR